MAFSRKENERRCCRRPDIPPYPPSPLLHHGACENSCRRTSPSSLLASSASLDTNFSVIVRVTVVVRIVNTPPNSVSWACVSDSVLWTVYTTCGGGYGARPSRPSPVQVALLRLATAWPAEGGATDEEGPTPTTPDGGGGCCCCCCHGALTGGG